MQNGNLESPPTNVKPTKPPKIDEVPQGTDWTKPVNLFCWYLPYTIGVSTNHAVQVGGYVQDGSRVGGIVRSLVHLPCGTVVATVEQSGGTGKFATLAFREGHGEVLG